MERERFFGWKKAGTVRTQGTVEEEEVEAEAKASGVKGKADRSMCKVSSSLEVAVLGVYLKEALVSLPNWHTSQRCSLENSSGGIPRTRLDLEIFFKSVHASMTQPMMSQPRRI